MRAHRDTMAHATVRTIEIGRLSDHAEHGFITRGQDDLGCRRGFVGCNPQTRPNDTFVKERYILLYRLESKIQGQAHGPAPTGMASAVLTIPKAFGFEAATQSQVDNLQIHV